MKLLKLLLAIALPPVAVFMTFGVSTTLLISILLTLFGWLPGSIHALWVVSKYEEDLRRVDG